MLRVLPSFWLGLLLMGVVSGTIRLWMPEGPVLASAFRSVLAVAVLGYLISTLVGLTKGVWRNWGSFARSHVLPVGLLAALMLFLFTDWLSRPYGWLAGPSVRGTILLLGGIIFMAMRRQKLASSFQWLLPLVTAALFLSFLSEAGGRLIFSDDHPVFYYRLETLKQMFPSIPFYMPWWNAGLDARDYFATGVLNVFFLFSPVIYLFDVAASYTAIVATILFVLPALSYYYSARILGYSAATGSLAALLALGMTSLWIRWGLSFGTMGFCLSIAMLPLAAALAITALEQRGQVSRLHVVILFLSTSLMLMWSLAGVAILPLVLATLFFAPVLLKQRPMRLLLLAFLIFHIPWVVMFFEVSKPLSVALKTNETVVSREALERIGTLSTADSDLQEAFELESRVVRARGHRLSVAGVLALMREKLQTVNPVFIFLLIPALLSLRSQMQRVLFSALVLWLLILAFVLSPLRPQLEFDRMLLPAAQLSALPLAVLFSLLLAQFQKKPRSMFTEILIAGALATALSGVLSTASAIRGRTWEHFHFAPQTVAEFVRAIDELEDPGFDGGARGRIVWPGFILHQFYEGHIAPLVLWTERSMAASSPFHNLWWYREFVPAEVRAGGSDAIEEYLDLYRASAIVVVQESWKRYVRRHPHIYTLHREVAPFRIYRRQSATQSYFVSGKGTILAEELDRVRFVLEEPEAVLAYRFFPFLQVNGCKLHPYDVGRDLEFVHLTDCPTNTVLELESVSPLKRLGLGVARVRHELFQ